MEKMAKLQTTKRIPQFRTYEEEARFWDTHSPEEFPEEFETAEVRFRQPLGFRLSVPLEPLAVERLEQICRECGMEPVALARQWILEHIPTP